MRDKRRRQSALLRIVRRRPVANQHEVVRWLKDMGFSATQASISRDLRELGLVKVDGHYCPLDRLPPAHPTAHSEALRELIIGAKPVGANLIVVRTQVGTAAAVAIALDGFQSPDIAGTVAGDDTIFVAVRSRSAQGRAVALLQSLQARAPQRRP